VPKMIHQKMKWDGYERNEPQVGNIFADSSTDESVSCENHNCENVKIQISNDKSISKSKVQIFDI
jgi:hypothetical protein